MVLKHSALVMVSSSLCRPSLVHLLSVWASLTFLLLINAGPYHLSSPLLMQACSSCLLPDCANFMKVHSPALTSVSCWHLMLSDPGHVFWPWSPPSAWSVLQVFDLSGPFFCFLDFCLWMNTFGLYARISLEFLDLDLILLVFVDLDSCVPHQAFWIICLEKKLWLPELGPPHLPPSCIHPAPVSPWRGLAESAVSPSIPSKVFPPEHQ